MNARPRGRPRSFSREQALQKALELFWAMGYEGTTVEALQKAMGGITAPSFYAAFGSKEALFREVIDLYGRTEGAPMRTALAEGKTARASVEGLLRAAATAFTQRDRPRGCLLSLSAVNCMPENRSVHDHARDCRLQRHKMLRQRLERGVAEGDIPQGVDLAALVSFYVAVIDGLSFSAQDGASRKTLESVVDGAVAAWSQLASKPRNRAAERAAPARQHRQGMSREAASQRAFEASQPAQRSSRRMCINGKVERARKSFRSPRA
jgi:AcrR family transcriptional regulator